jgi:hypothetical protein
MTEPTRGLVDTSVVIDHDVIDPSNERLVFSPVPSLSLPGCIFRTWSQTEVRTEKYHGGEKTRPCCQRPFAAH